MADRRMIHKAVICSDAFVDMSYEAQALFFQLQIEADAYGLLSSVKKILRSVRVQESALEELEQAGFIISFGNGVIALRHWNVANTRKNDRTEKCLFPREKALLAEDENKTYYLLESDGIQMESDGIQRNPKARQLSLAELSVAQNSLEEVKGTEPPPTLDDVRELMTKYAVDKEITVDANRSAERFWNHYTAHGWKMVDWKPLAANWVDEDAQKQKPAPMNNPALNYAQRDIPDYSCHVIDLDHYFDDDVTP